jgi:TetR/AcrR family transcriptional regulator, repressor of fatR-cypB operon
VRCKDVSKVDAIFKATLTLVKDRGLAGITMCDISKEASIGTGTLYIYFKNKDELIKALFTECRKQSAHHYFEGVEEQISFEERMEKLFQNIICYKMKNFEVSAFLEQSYHSPYVDIIDLKKKQKAMNPLFDLIREGIVAKKIRETEVDLIVSYLFGVVNEMVKKAYFSNKKITRPVITEVYAMFWNGIKYYN